MRATEVLTSAQRSCVLPILKGQKDRVAKHAQELYTGRARTLESEAAQSSLERLQSQNRIKHLGKKRVPGNAIY